MKKIGRSCIPDLIRNDNRFSTKKSAFTLNKIEGFADLVRLTNLLNDWLDTLESNVTQKRGLVKIFLQQTGHFIKQ